MRVVRLALTCAILAAALPTAAQDSPNRKEMRRADLSGAPGMEVILSVSEYKPGEAISKHFHHGVEAGYILEGGKVGAPGTAGTDLATGAPIMNLRDALHGGWTNVGASTIKLLTVHVVDKGKPLYDEKK